MISEYIAHIIKIESIAKFILCHERSWIWNFYDNLTEMQHNGFEITLKPGNANNTTSFVQANIYKDKQITRSAE